MNTNILTVFYDGYCPLCSLEMHKLKQADDKNLINLVNLHQDGFHTHYPYIQFNKAMAILHGEYQGQILLVLDVTHRAWTLVGRGMWVAPLQWPVIKQISHACYLLVAKYRHPISNFLHRRFGLGNSTCEQGTCYGKANNDNHRS